MILELRDAAVAHGALPPTSVAVRSGAVRLVAVEGDQRPTVLSLVAGARMRPDAGAASLREDDGRVLPARAARRAIALVDTPVVAQHPDDVRVGTVVREELALADRRGVHLELARLGLADRARDAFGSLPTRDRIRLLAGIASRRRGVQAIVVTSPERHGGDPAGWMRELRELAAFGPASPGTASPGTASPGLSAAGLPVPGLAAAERPIVERPTAGRPTAGLAVLVVTDAATVRAVDALGLPDPLGIDAVPLYEGTLS